jgi:hypothetical protein
MTISLKNYHMSHVTCVPVCSRVKATEGAFRCKSQSQNGFDFLEENAVKMSYMYDNFTEKIITCHMSRVCAAFICILPLLPLLALLPLLPLLPTCM